MKRTTLILLGIYFALSIGINAQDSTIVTDKQINDASHYGFVMAVAKRFLRMNEPSEAIKILIQLREKQSPGKDLFICLGDAYSKMNVGELAISNYTEAERIDSLDIDLKFKIAETLYKQKRYTDAVNKYLKVISIDPNNKEAYLKAATIFYAAKLYADAAVMYEKYLGIDKSKEAFENISKAFLEIRNYQKAFEFSIQGHEKYPSDLTLDRDAGLAAYALASITMKNYQDSLSTNSAEKSEKLLKEAKSKFADATKYYSMVPDTSLSVGDLRNAGYSYQSLGADSVAIKYFEQVVKKDSTQSGLFMDMANTYFRNKQNELAIKYYQAKIKVDSTYEPAYRYMGFAYFSTGGYEGARNAFLKATSLVDTSFESHYWLIQTYLKMDSTEQVSERYTKLLQMAEGKESQYRDRVLEAVGYLGQRAFIKKNYNGAITYLSRALRIKPGEWRFMEMLGACYHQLQNYDEAIKWYRATLKSNPKSEVAKKGLRMLSAD